MGCGASEFSPLNATSKISNTTGSSPQAPPNKSVLTRTNTLHTIQNVKIISTPESKSIYCPPPSDHALSMSSIKPSTTTLLLSSKRQIRNQPQSIKITSLGGPSEESKSNSGYWPTTATPSQIDANSTFEALISAQPIDNRVITNGSKIDESITIDNTQNIEQWRVQDVEMWLVKNNLSQFKSKFDQFDGRKLLALQDMYTKAPSIYFKEIKRFLDKPGLDQVLQLTSALTRLQL